MPRAGQALSHPSLVMKPFQPLPAQFPEAGRGWARTPEHPLPKSPLPSLNLPQRKPSRTSSRAWGVPHWLAALTAPLATALPGAGSVPRLRGTRAGDAVWPWEHPAGTVPGSAQLSQPAAAISCPRCRPRSGRDRATRAGETEAGPHRRLSWLLFQGNVLSKKAAPGFHRPHIRDADRVSRMSLCPHCCGLLPGLPQAGTMATPALFQHKSPWITR